ncbi:hypothetical protein [Streptomyces sp. NPDC059371]|uniref:hypothetical protein n=1 Tax=Streptomyces sp. NPDC059371 TaxID=3346812 RepID=UPI0036C1ED0E
MHQRPYLVVEDESDLRGQGVVGLRDGGPTPSSVVLGWLGGTISGPVVGPLGRDELVPVMAQVPQELVDLYEVLQLECFPPFTLGVVESFLPLPALAPAVVPAIPLGRYASENERHDSPPELRPFHKRSLGSG